MGMAAGTSHYAYTANRATGSFRLQTEVLKGLQMSELWLPLAMQAWKSLSFHRITEQPQLEGTHKDHRVQLLSPHRSTYN